MKNVVFVAMAGLAASAGADFSAQVPANLLNAQPGGVIYNTLSPIANNVIPGDTFTAEPLVQTTTTAFYTDDSNASLFTFGTTAPGGNNLANAGTVSVTESSVTPLGGNQFLAAVAIYHADAATGGLAIWVAQGVTGPNGAPFVSWRGDVGALAAATDPIDIQLGAGQSIVVHSASFTVFNTTGAVLGTFGLTVNASTGTTLGGVGVVGLGGANIAGFNLSGMELQWHYEIIPAPSSVALLGLGGLLAARRRR
ncbi:MAG: PEP-CTERM sorting domain-containing protein [Phycisphaeraceae bacterium]|nr:PEP-CTERM sorting domain-containing protein [Phycisphaeraceae bacterium]MCW5753734.1 PEP-CTERM sorting domain-containing protein [Phycisphaeraceae bacterium]